jgi:hypothetical protein
MGFRKLWEFEAEIGARGDIDGLKDALGFGAIDDLEFSGVVTRDCTAKLSFFVNAYMDAGRHVSKIGDAVETTAQVAPNWFDLSNAEEDWVHESEGVKGHLEKVRSPSISISCATMLDWSMRPVPRVQLRVDLVPHIPP